MSTPARTRGGGAGGAIPVARVLTLEGDAPDPTALIVGDIAMHRQAPTAKPGRAMRRLARLLDRSGKTVREDHKRPGGLPSTSGWNTTL